VGCNGDTPSKGDDQDTTHAAVCESYSWNKDPKNLGPCDSLLFEDFLSEAEWIGDTVPSLVRERWRSTAHYYEGLKRLPPRIRELYWVGGLAISRSDSLTELPSEIYDLPVLTTLGLSNLGSLRTLPNLTHKCTLHEINIEFLPHLDTLPSGLWLANIHSMNINNSGLKKLPSRLPQMDSLAFLRVAYDSLTEIPENIVDVVDFRALAA